MKADPPPETLLNQEQAEAAQGTIQRILSQLKNVIFGQDKLLEDVVAGVLAGGHILLEGVPGLGKTELAKGLGTIAGLEVKRVQFTPDLLPGDITGSPVLQMVEGERRFVFQRGPVFCNLLLADEINRASPKTQSALLQAMQEREVTVAGDTHQIHAPFCVLATQNPIELEGTYPLPEAQLDRFLLKIDVQRSDLDTLQAIVERRTLGQNGAGIEQVLSADDLLSLQAQVRRVYLPPVVARYIARLVNATHAGESKAAEAVRFGSSPRGAIGLAAASRARALIEGRRHASFEDAERMALPVLKHRIILQHTARLEGLTSESIVQNLLREIQPQEKDIPDVLKPTDA